MPGTAAGPGPLGPTGRRLPRAEGVGVRGLDVGADGHPLGQTGTLQRGLHGRARLRLPRTRQPRPQPAHRKRDVRGNGRRAHHRRDRSHGARRVGGIDQPRAAVRGAQFAAARIAHEGAGARSTAVDADEVVVGAGSAAGSVAGSVAGPSRRAVTLAAGRGTPPRASRPAR